jgi:hypothetical protein
MVGMLLRDKVLLYQHDLAAETWTKNKQMLRWNLAQGYGLSNSFHDGDLTIDNNRWLDLVGVFQKYALARYADELVVGYENVDGHITRTSFKTFVVTANWDKDNPYTLDGNTIAADGVQTRAKDGSVTAGVYTAYNGNPLSDGDHFLVEVRTAANVRLYQPVGEDTTVHLKWHDKATVSAYRYDGTLIGAVDSTMKGDDVSFRVSSKINDQVVGYYEVK